MSPIYLLGGARTDFKRNFKKEGMTLRDIVPEIARQTLASTGIEPRDVQAGIVGNFAGGLYTRQLHLGALLLEADEQLRGIPTLHVEAACASGSLAVLTAAQWIMAGLYDCVLVVGAEQQKTMAPIDGSDVLGAAGDYHREKPQYGDFMFPKLFGRIAQRYMEHYPSLTEADLARVAVKNYAHARLNPLAQMRDASMDFDAASTESQTNWRIAESPLKLHDCSQITDGAAGVVLCSERFLDQLAHRTSRSEPGECCGPVELIGWGHSTDRLALDDKDAPAFPQARRAIQTALRMANVRDPRELQGIEVHDCFSISEVIAYELIGLAAPGDGASLLHNGATMLPAVRAQLLGADAPPPPFSIPVNAGGGLMADGHPVGATGVRQVLDAYEQISGCSGSRQIENVRRFLTYNVGGSMTTAVAMVWGAPSLIPVPPLRILTAVPICDGHDSAINTINLEFIRHGIEVIYLGYHRQSADIVRAAIQEDVAAIGLSSYNGGHVEFFGKVRARLRAAGASHIGLFGGGGGTITEADAAEMLAQGTDRIFFAGTPLDDMIGWVKDFYANRPPTLPAGDSDMALAAQLSAFESGVNSPSVPSPRRARVIGVTGPGGAGKTTLIDELVLRFLNARPLEARVAILSHDPSVIGAGALLGDRATMIYSQDPRVFMRSMATRGQGGGLSPATGQCLAALAGCGQFELVFIETVGIGQEAMPFNADLVDCTALVMNPDYGARLQLQKIVMLDLADIVVINKSDLRGARTASAELERRLEQNRRGQKLLSTVANRHRDAGVNELFATLIAPAH